MRTIILAALALGVASPLAARSAVAEPPKPTSSPGSWVLTEDYPAAALRDEIEGVVRFSITVDALGRPTDCSVSESSGNADLDSTACAKILERGEFEPARNSRGKPVAGTWSNSVRWIIPEPQPAPAPGYLVASFIVETDGTVSECVVDRAEGAIEKAREEMCKPDMSVQPILDSDGEPVRKRVRVMMRVVHEDVPQ
jgi:TonB family protein